MPPAGFGGLTHNNHAFKIFSQTLSKRTQERGKKGIDFDYILSGLVAGLWSLENENAFMKACLLKFNFYELKIWREKNIETR